MDELVVETFLESVKKVSWRRHVKTPVKGTNLYTKFMRPCRPMGTSVDVKDSSFRSLGWFLQFLEAEGLLRLQPGLTDPVVMDINFEACRKYKYDPQTRPFALTPTVVPPHNPGCFCRLCTECRINTTLSAAPTPQKLTGQTMSLRPQSFQWQ